MAIQTPKRVDPQWYTPEDEEESENPARFKIRPLNTGETMEIMGTYVNGAPSFRTFKQCFLAGTIGFENITDGDGKKVQAPQQFLSLPNQVDIAIEVGAKIFDISVLSPDEAKN